nr:dTDP-4-dehydrorhamnose reductase [Saccharopolyspora sp. HNM0983]
MAVLVPGGRGQLGAELARVLRGVPGALVHAPGSGELDVTDGEVVGDAVSSFTASAKDAGLRPVVVNAAAFTAVDAAEEDQRQAERINTTGAAQVAAACRDSGAGLVHVSTDYVFPGDADRPYEPTDETGPKTAYGRTKLDGEHAVLDSGARAWVVRTAWVYSAGGQNFVRTMLRLAAERETLSVVDDQVGTPTWAADLARGLLELAGQIARRHGPDQRVLHCTNTGSASWFELARAVFAGSGLDEERVQPCSSAQFPRPAPRPGYSVLSDRAWREAGLTPLRPWREALGVALHEFR